MEKITDMRLSVEGDRIAMRWTEKNNGWVMTAREAAELITFLQDGLAVISTPTPTPAPEARKPLTEDQIYEAFREHDKTHSLVASAWSFEAGVRFAEECYGIASPSGAEGGER